MRSANRALGPRPLCPPLPLPPSALLSGVLVGAAPCRDLNELLDAYERGEKFYLYTGRVRRGLLANLTA
jgi:hypothetical protein